MGRTSQTTIEINGKRYDARTGKLLNSMPKKPVGASALKPAKTVVKSGNRMSDITRAALPAKNLNRRRTERSQTLMRGVVKKPAAKPSAKQAVHRAPSDIKPAVKKVLKPTIAPAPERQMRATQIKRSSQISKFGVSQKNAVSQNTRSNNSTVIKRTEPMPVRPAPAVKAAPKTNKTHTIIEQGLKNAQSHNQTFNKKTAKKIAKAQSRKKPARKKLLNYVAGALALVLLTGFITYQNIPNLTMRYASARSGMQASLPGYQPAGFSLSNRISYNPGQVVLNFSSNTDDRKFTITQKQSAWNSEALLSNYISTKTDQVHKYEDKGRTIFLYGENNATWVNGGIWYDISGNSQLNSDQLIRIASSL